MARVTIVARRKVLDKNDLKEIARIVDIRIGEFGIYFDKELKKTEGYLEDKIEFNVIQSEHRLENKIEKVEDQLASVESRLGIVESDIVEVADHNQEFLDQFLKNIKKNDNHEVRIVKLEKKAKIAS